MVMLKRVIFNDTATTEIYTLSLHDALPISEYYPHWFVMPNGNILNAGPDRDESWVLNFAGSSLTSADRPLALRQHYRSEEHTSELQSRQYHVCRLLLEKKNKTLPIPPRLKL